MNEILPVRRPQDNPELSRFVENFVGTEISSTNIAQHAMELIDGKHRGGRIVDGGRKRLQRDVDGNPERKSRVLLHGALRSERHGCEEIVLVDRGSAAEQVEQGIVHRDEIADLGY